MIAIAPQITTATDGTPGPGLLLRGISWETYQALVLPIVTPEILGDWLTRATTMGETSWAKAIREWGAGCRA
jgi:hypothetical protein